MILIEYALERDRYIFFFNNSWVREPCRHWFGLLASRLFGNMTLPDQIMSWTLQNRL